MHGIAFGVAFGVKVVECGTSAQARQGAEARESVQKVRKSEERKGAVLRWERCACVIWSNDVVRM